MSLISADRIKDLKERVKAECTRRAFSGSVVSYAGTEYDYEITPAPGVIIKQEHRDKIATPLNAINPDTVTKANGPIEISDEDITNMEAFVTVLEIREPTDHQGTDCKGGCTGMCYGCQGTCYNACTGCTSCTSCTGCTSCTSCTGCSSSCWSKCASDCTGGCSGTCTGSCQGGCQGGCLKSCWALCATACFNGGGWN